MSNTEYLVLEERIGRPRIAQLLNALLGLAEHDKKYAHIRVAGSNFRSGRVEGLKPTNHYKIDGLPIEVVKPGLQENWKFSRGLNYIMGGNDIPPILNLLRLLQNATADNPTACTHATFTINDLIAELTDDEFNEAKDESAAALEKFFQDSIHTPILKNTNESLQERFKDEPNLLEQIRSREGYYKKTPHKIMLALTIKNFFEILQEFSQTQKPITELTLRTSLDQGDTHNVAFIAKFLYNEKHGVVIQSCLLDSIERMREDKIRPGQHLDFQYTIPLALNAVLNCFNIKIGYHKHDVFYLGNQFGGYCTSHAQRLAKEADFFVNGNDQMVLQLPQLGLMHDGDFNLDYSYNQNVVCEEIDWSIQRLKQIDTELNDPQSSAHQLVFKILLDYHINNHEDAFISLKKTCETLGQIGLNMRADWQRVTRQRLGYCHYKQMIYAPRTKTHQPLTSETYETSLFNAVHNNHNSWPTPSWLKEQLNSLALDDWQELALEFFEQLLAEYNPVLLNTLEQDAKEQYNLHTSKPNMHTGAKTSKNDATCCVIS